MKDRKMKGFGDVFVNNLVYYLEKKGISQKEYSEENGLDKSIISKWKNKSSYPSKDHVKQAADYFEITTNDLMYTEKEKRKLEILGDNTYNPIMAQHSINVRLFGAMFENPFFVILSSLLVFTIIGLAVFLLRGHSGLYALLILIGVPLTTRYVKNNFFHEETYIINYLDDIFYSREESDNKFFYLSLFIKVISFLAIFYYMSVFTNMDVSNDFNSGLFVTLGFLMILLGFSIVLSIFHLPRKFDANIYDDEIEPYNFFRLSLVVHFAILAIAIMLCILDFRTYLLFLIIIIVLVIANTIDFSFLSKEYSRYSLVYQEDEKKPRELFPK